MTTRPKRLEPSLGRIFRRGLRRVTEAPLVHGNAAELLIDGPAAFPAMLERIAAAERSVDFENYIIRDDVVGRRFAAALAERARSGVRVRVLYDWLGSISTPRTFWNVLRRAGCEVRVFGPPSFRRPHAMLRRDHRKLVVVDGREAVVGGLCIGQEWTDDGGRGCWRDTAVRLSGPIARELERSFLRLWRRADARRRDRAAQDRRRVRARRGGRREPGDRPDIGGPPGRGGAIGSVPDASPAGEVAVRMVDGPATHARAYRLYQLVAALAERSLYITGAYPLAPAALRRALSAAARAGVDVRLLAPDRSDVPAINDAARAHYRSLLRAGIRIYEWKGPMLHAKTLVADGRLALIGSSNLNPISLFGCHELDVTIEDAGVAGRLEAQFIADLDRATEITLDGWRRRPRLRRWNERAAAALLWLPYKVYSG